MKKEKNKKYRVTFTMELTEAQEIALKAMFGYWNHLSSMGSSRYTTFFADGDGNFHPNVTMDGDKIKSFHLDNELVKLACVKDEDGNRTFDFDPVAWKINQ